MVVVGEVAGAVALEVVIAVPPKRVFRALTSAEELSRFIPEFSEFEFDARLGGAYRFSRRDETGRLVVRVRGEVVEFDPPHRLTLTWRPEDSPLPETQVRFTLEPAAGGTKLTLVHTAFAPAYEEARSQHEDHWRADLVHLKTYLEHDAPAPQSET